MRPFSTFHASRDGCFWTHAIMTTTFGYILCWESRGKPGSNTAGGNCPWGRAVGTVMTEITSRMRMTSEGLGQRLPLERSGESTYDIVSNFIYTFNFPMNRGACGMGESVPLRTVACFEHFPVRSFLLHLSLPNSNARIWESEAYIARGKTKRWLPPAAWKLEQITRRPSGSQR